MLQDINLSDISIDTLSLPLLTKKKVSASVLRLDKIHPLVSGNKWFKLRYYLQEAKEQQKKTVVTFGGAWSNHILATAAACKMNQLNSIGIIRGEEAVNLSPTLIRAKELDMQLVFTSRENYSRKEVPAEINKKETYLINEGGFGLRGAEGASTILEYCKKENYTHICCAAGTGTMMAGLINEISLQQQVIGISVLKNNSELETSIQSLLKQQAANFTINHNYHFGGYAKHKPELTAFMNSFYQQTNIPTDFVYTGKLFYGINNLITIDFFEPDSRILLIHSGGLQGNSSLRKGTLIF